ncbi:MAG TPA: single-stranded-DNA-specific exonuclease RecJ [Verrucomicrobiota bacterium]|nr:single-stranded-DNA-specific exonuclease RecJ [Verrucomicrobiota bacterium]HNU51204.1 single-stranded-DNA-specific exonuclease RecJ [Verrucomicrobiota bacterium]
MNCRWILPPTEPGEISGLAAELAVSPLLARCLWNRGLRGCGAARDFLEPRLRNLSDPLAIPGLSAAITRLDAARARGERVLVFGDYDVDGITATALLLQVLRALGWSVDGYLPHRLEEGYGLTREAVENALQQHPATLLVAVDCGSTATATIDWLRGQGVDTIVVDHHQVTAPGPAAVALVNPHAASEGTNGRELCSVGLAFKLAHALVKRERAEAGPGRPTLDLRHFLDLVALGTIADLVPLTGENRILVSAGLARLNDARRPGLAALARVAQVPQRIGPCEVAFQLGPRLNAAGRLESAGEALQLLMEEDAERAVALAESLDAQNRERQAIERSIAEHVIHAVRARFHPETDYVIVEGSLEWHVGVVGIVASRVLHEFYRPTLILGGDGHCWRGSGRSIEGFDLACALRGCGDLLERHGGHAMAAGVTVRPENVAALRRRLNEQARRVLTAESLLPPLRLDGTAVLGELTLEQLAEFRRLEPGGQGNPPVQLVVRGLRLCRPPHRIGREQQHLKLRVSDGRTSCDVVWWGGGSKPWPTDAFDLACAPQINEYDGRRTVQLKLLDWRPAAAR